MTVLQVKCYYMKYFNNTTQKLRAAEGRSTRSMNREHTNIIGKLNN